VATARPDPTVVRAARHAAIVAREQRLPAVVAIGDATRRLRDGPMVTVDGNRGVVRVVGEGS